MGEHSEQKNNMQADDESIFGETAGNEEEKCFMKNQWTGTINTRKKYETVCFCKLLIFIETKYFSHKIHPNQISPPSPFSSSPHPLLTDLLTREKCGPLWQIIRKREAILV